MVFGIITAIAACPAIVGTTEAIRYGQKQNNREENRGRKHCLTVTLPRKSIYSATFDGAPIVLKDNKLFVDTRADGVRTRQGDELFPATTNYLPYPGRKQLWREAGYAKGEGFVTLINAQRVLNWVYVDRRTHEVKYGVRADAESHEVGPWDCTFVDRRLTFQGWEGFIAVQEKDGDELWALYFDVEDDGLTGGNQPGRSGDLRMLEIDVWRREVRRSREDAVAERLERLELRNKV